MNGMTQPQPATSQYLNPGSVNGSRSYNEQQTVISDSGLNTQTRFKQAGYIVGPPVAYTQDPVLPSNFQPFSPEQKNVNVTSQPTHLPVVFSRERDMSPNTSNRHAVVTSSPIKYSNTNISHHPVSHNTSHGAVSSTFLQQGSIQSDTVPRVTFERCASECKNWETKYNELHLKYLNVTTNSHGGDSYALR